MAEDRIASKDLEKTRSIYESNSVASTVGVRRKNLKSRVVVDQIITIYLTCVDSGPLVEIFRYETFME